MERSERGLLIVMLFITSYMFIESLSFADSVARFPRFTSGMTIIGVVLLLSQNYLPKPIKTFVTESIDLDDSSSISNEEKEVQSVEMNNSSDGLVSDSLFTVLAVSTYSLLSYLFGILWITPLFVIVYTHRFGLSKRIIALLSTVAFLLAYVFMIVLTVRMDSGVLFGGI